MSQTSKKRPAATPQVPQRRPPSASSGTRPRSGSGSNRPRAVEPRRDPFPIILGAVIGAAIVGVGFLVFLLASNNKGAAAATNPPVATTAASTGAGAGAAVTPVAQPTTVDDAPRMPLADFMALYNDPAKRPLIIDVRAKQYFDEGHIKGAISFPESDVDSRVNELPKDKMIVAYCQ